MDKEWLEKKDSFTCKSDIGALFTVECWQSMVETQSIDGETSTLPGVVQYKLADGSPVNCIDSQTFEIVSTGKQVTKFS